MNGLWNLDNILYQAIIYPIEDINDRKSSNRISSTKWKIRYGNYKFSFSHEHLKNQYALSKHYWGLKNKGLTPDIQWSILKRSNTLQSLSTVDAICFEKKKSTFCFFHIYIYKYI